MRILICLVLAAADCGQTPSNEARITDDIPKLRTCAGELERLVTPGNPVEDCLLNVGAAFYVLINGERTWQPYVIASDGVVELPLLGELHAAGMKLAQLTATINAQLPNHTKHSIVRVILTDNGRLARYFVDGNVLHPGRYLPTAPLTVLEAIEKADGSVRAPHHHKVRVVRGESLLKLDYRRLSKHPEQNVPIQNGDHILLLP